MIKTICSRQAKQVIVSFFILVITHNQTVSPIDVAQLKDTYSILSDEYKPCSPVYGAVWVETGILKKYYKYHAVGTDNKPKYATIKLIQRLFNITGDSFGITRNLGEPAHFFSPHIVGLIIGTLETSKQNKKELPKKIETLINNDAGFLQRVKASLSSTSSEKSEQELRIINQRTTQLSKLIATSCDEQLYPHYTTYAILLGFLYILSNNKQDLRDYFNALNATIGKDIFTPAGKNLFTQTTWNSSAFDKNTADSIINISAVKSTIQPSQHMVSQFFAAVATGLPGMDPFEAIVFAEITKQFYSKSLPQIIANRKDYINFQGRPFPDCTEIALRNLCNFIVFNQDELKFIPTKTDTLNPSSEVIHYYQGENADATKHLRSDMYQKWGNLLQSIPGAIYAVMASHNFSEHYNRLLLGNTIFNYNAARPAYVLLKQEDIQTLSGLKKSPHGNRYEFTIGNEPYIVANPSQYSTYALWINLKNIIILLNRLFGLKLYDSNPLAPFNDVQFCSKYFPVLCEKLGWGFSCPINLDTPYFDWGTKKMGVFTTIHMWLIKDTRVRWNLDINFHHIEVKHLQTPSLSSIPQGYKETLYNGLLESNESENLYALLALYASQKTAQQDRAIDRLLIDNSTKNRFAMYLQDLNTLMNNLELRKNALTAQDIRAVSALQLAQNEIEIPKPPKELKKTKGPKNVLPSVWSTLKQLRGKLSQLKNNLNELKAKIGVLKKALAISQS